VGAAAGLACPACEVGIGDETVQTTLSGYLFSYGFLAAAPFVIVATILGGIMQAVMAEAQHAPGAAG
jgi:hypothetical protein